MSSLKEKTVKGVLWSGLDRFFSQGIQVVFSILIARILLPSDYGVVAMLSIFLAVAQTFVDSGFGAALIRKPDRTDEDFSTVFYFNIAIAVIFYALLWLASPVIAAFYDIPVLEDITRVMGLIVVFSSISFVQGTKLTIAIDFRSRAIISIFVNALTGIAGLWLAKVGYGVWALALQPDTGAASDGSVTGSCHPLAGMAFQRHYEELAYRAGAGKVPVQLYGDLRQGAVSSGFGAFQTCMKGQWQFANLRDCLPSYIVESLLEGMEAFGQRIRGFDREDTIVSGVETRTSSPVRIERDESGQSSLRGLIPCGEGAGYAGGITSAAMDGIRMAEAAALQILSFPL